MAVAAVLSLFSSKFYVLHKRNWNSLFIPSFRQPLLKCIPIYLSNSLVIPSYFFIINNTRSFRNKQPYQSYEDAWSKICIPLQSFWIWIINSRERILYLNTKSSFVISQVSCFIVFFFFFSLGIFYKYLDLFGTLLYNYNQLFFYYLLKYFSFHNTKFNFKKLFTISITELWINFTMGEPIKLKLQLRNMRTSALWWRV